MDRDLLRSTSLRQAMVSFARRRGTGADAEDAVQATLTEAWQKAERPAEPDELRRWLWGILRHKVVDVHRRRSREVAAGDLESPPLGVEGMRAPSEAVASPDGGANDLLHWASRNLPHGKDTEQTLEWLLREADGESLEHIAEEAALPPARVRKRVSRLREHFRAHWRRDVAALAALGIVAGGLLWVWPSRPPTEPMAKDPAPLAPDPRHLRALELHELAHDACERGAWQPCLALLDEARSLGEPEPPRAAADRQRARQRLEAPPPAPSASVVVPKPPRPSTPSTPPPSSTPPKRSGSSL